MLRAPELPDDAERLAALYALKILDTPQEERFDRFTRIASQFFGVPIALVSLVDVNRQWFKSCFGLDATETSRDISFCGHAIVQDQTFVIENASEDPRFADNPLVAGEPNIRFYAGQPLRAGDGSLVGTFCLIDRKPRKFGDADRLALIDFGRMVETELNLVNLAELHHQLLRSQEKQKKAQEERDRLFTNSLDLLCIAGFDGYFVRINPMFTKTLGYSEDEILATPFMDFVHPEDLEATSAAMQTLAEGIDIVQFENRYRCKDGSFRWLAWNTRAPSSDDQLLYAVARDITDRKAIQEALRDSEARFKSLFEHSPEAIVLLDLDTIKFTDANQNALDLFQLDRESLLNTGPVELSPLIQPNGQSSIEMAEEKIKAALDGDVAVFEWMHLRSNAEPVPCEVRMVPMMHNKRPSLRASITDVSWRKETERQLRKAKDEAEAANQAKSDFLANMSHEIRTPMNAVLGMTEMVLDMELTDVQRDYLQTVHESGESLLNIINEILDFSKIEAGQLQLENYPFSLRELIGDTMKSLAFRAHSHGLELAWQVDADVPDSFSGDANRMRQIIVNLVGNSIKFTKQGEIVVRVVQEKKIGNAAELKFAVRDTGIGIPPNRLETVFEAFQQADSSTTRHFGGTGLGLTICSRLVELMEGKIWVESELEVGSTFFFTCLLGTRPDSEASPRPDLSRLQGVRVLVVDDNQTNRKILKETLSKWGLLVAMASNANDAINQLQHSVAAAEPISLVITDLHMPTIDGFGLSRMIRQQIEAPSIKIIMLTSGVGRDHTELCSQLEISRHLLKPVKQSELLSAIFIALEFEPDLQTANPVNTKHVAEVEPQNILLVEDGLANQKLAMALLQRWGHEVTIAENGVEAVAAVEKRQFDLVLMDVQMPEMDGLEATREIRKREQATGRHITIIAMTAHAMAGDREKCLEAGMDGYLSKPVRKAELYDVLHATMGYPPSIDSKHLEKRMKVDRTEVVDWEEARKVVDGDEEILREIAAVAFDELTLLMKRLKTAVDDRDAAQIQRTAHTIRGTLRVFKNADAAELVDELEARGRENNLVGLDTPFARLHQLCTQILDELSQYKSR